jgi:hypothetical protein
LIIQALIDMKKGYSEEKDQSSKGEKDDYADRRLDLGFVRVLRLRYISHVRYRQFFNTGTYYE